jgi:chromosome segregation ATPase
MSIPVSYDLAAFNIAQQVKFKEDINQKEARLGVWKITHSIYYVSSSECKLAKIWFDFLRLIGLVADSKDKIFVGLANASEKQFDHIETAFNSPKFKELTHEIKEQAASIERLNKRQAKSKKKLQTLENENVSSGQKWSAKADKLISENKALGDKITTITKTNDELLKSKNALTENLHLLKIELAEASNSQKHSQEAISNHRNDKDQMMLQLKTMQKKIDEHASKTEEHEKKLSSVTKSYEDLQKEKAVLHVQIKSKDETIAKLQQDKKLLISEKNHDEKKLQDNADELEKVKKEHHHHITKQGLDLEIVNAQLKKEALIKEDDLKKKDEEISNLKAQITALTTKGKDANAPKQGEKTE